MRTVQRHSGKIFLWIGLLFALILLAAMPLAGFLDSGTRADAAVSGFVTRSGSQLMLSGQPFRFSGANVYWLGTR